MSPGVCNEGYQNTGSPNGSGITTDVENVFISGAGPAGVMLASTLARYGIKSMIVDDRPDKTSTGRADGLQPKTIETFRQLRLADGLLQRGVRIYDICFWNSTATERLHRTGRETHYPKSLDVNDPFILLVHQGMVEDVFLDDMAAYGVHVERSLPFDAYEASSKEDDQIRIECKSIQSGVSHSFHARYLVGCDGAHSKVRKSMPGLRMDGDPSKAPWGVLDGVIQTDFPDLWSKVVIHSEEKGTILCIPRERNMTRLYIELSPKAMESMPSDAATQEFVMQRAKKIIAPYTLHWESVEWFSVYRVGQRVANEFMDDSGRVFITGDASHQHSPKAAQGMNTSMHDTFNLSWKLNLAVRGLAKPSLLRTYETERRKVAIDLINFDFEHANAFAAGDEKALAENFAKNIGFISGAGIKYETNVLNETSNMTEGTLRPGSLLPPSKVTRYVDANPVDIQLDIPMLGQFRVFFLTRNIHVVKQFLCAICSHVASTGSVLGRASLHAAKSYNTLNTTPPESMEFVQSQRYISVSKLATYALVSSMPKHEIEIADLPDLLQKSRWTFYLDDNDQQSGGCIDKWLGHLEDGETAIVNVRPDGYVGSAQKFEVDSAALAMRWLDDYYDGFLAN